MKKPILSVFCILLTLTIQAQNYVSEFRAMEPDPEVISDISRNLQRAGVNTNPYEYSPVAETPVPKGFKPFYISHYGRHGSRSEWSHDNYASLLERWNNAHQAGLLTPEGESSRERVILLAQLHDGMDGRLTARGALEHRQIASRMYKKYKRVFKSGSRHVRAISSVAPRCLVSMAAATAELLSLDPGLRMSWDTGEKLMLICSTEDTKDIKKEVYKILDQQRLAHIPDTAAFLARVLTEPSKARSVFGDPVRLMQDTFDIAAVSGAFDLDNSLLEIFTLDDLYWYSQCISMNMYLRQCNSKEWGDKRMKPVHYLVEDVLQKADAAIQNGDCVADLRFGHEYQVIAFSSRIGVKGIAERRDAVASASWPGHKYVPFACNLQMVFYRNKSGEVLVKFFLNEQETTLLTLPGGPYYRWEEVKRSILENRAKNL